MGKGKGCSSWAAPSSWMKGHCRRFSQHFVAMTDTERGWDLNLGTSILASGESPPASDYKVALRDEKNCTLGGKLRTVRYKNATNQWPPLSKTKVLCLIPAHSTTKGVGRPPKPPLQSAFLLIFYLLLCPAILQHHGL